MAREKKDVMAERRDLLVRAAEANSIAVENAMAAVVELCRTIDDMADKIASAIVIASCETNTSAKQPAPF
jgi:hypothetical protein